MAVHQLVHHGDVHKIESKVLDGCVVGENSYDYLAVNKMFYRLVCAQTPLGSLACKSCLQRCFTSRFT
jgi:hypothetical protein